MRAILVVASLLLATLVLAPSASAQDVDRCVGKPTLVEACAGTDGTNACAGVGFGLQGVGVCAGSRGVTVCIGFNCFGIGLN